ncbi:MAG: SDR family oxidoreductase [Actinomycetota bacterium]|nr:SDR family oxidoreductase [Actinomycetota bacterium]
MDLRLDGKTAVVTGGSRGIGRGIAEAYAQAGANVMLVSRKADSLETTAKELEGLGGDVAWFAGHVGREEDAAACVDATLERFGAIDVLVNNAATNPWAGPTIDVDLPRWDKTHEVNLRAPLLWTQEVWRRWMRDHGGCVINIASVGGFKTSSQLGVYAVFKAALVHLTRQLGAELGPGTRVNCIAPGLIKTDFARILWEGERGEAVAQRYPLGRLGEPEDIGRAALFVAAGATWMTGQTLVLDGGELVRFEEAEEG